MSTVAGTGIAGYSGDGRPATAAKLNSPLFIAVDGPGNIYIPDHQNIRFRKVDLAGNTNTIAGTGTRWLSGRWWSCHTAAQVYGPNSVSLDAAGNLYLADQIKIRK
jgi:hypothetical protein